jgi:hypothetical protein
LFKAQPTGGNEAKNGSTGGSTEAQLLILINILHLHISLIQESIQHRGMFYGWLSQHILSYIPKLINICSLIQKYEIKHD